ncbi:MAG: YkgJ family cysteine cluster protein, partial [Desulfamplus sp.]|nr:YkgJ family cysteine cluster protein [Desulfamplus sp.]
MKSKDIKEKQAILKQLFMLFDRFSNKMNRACEEGCKACCTRNVTLTSLEAKYILDSLNSDEKDTVLTKIANEHHKKRLIPKTTINELAKLCMAGEEPPEEFSDPLWGECPLLSNKRCMIYELRPFACRSMISKNRCDLTGFAEMDEYMVTLSNLFMQYLEHIDNGGYFGNLSDMLLFEGDKGKYGSSIPPETMLVNKQLEMLMVPPEHRERIADVINAI